MSREYSRFRLFANVEFRVDEPNMEPDPISPFPASNRISASASPCNKLSSIWLSKLRRPSPSLSITSSQPQSPFFKLPYELRHEIYLDAVFQNPHTTLTIYPETGYKQLYITHEHLCGEVALSRGKKGRGIGSVEEGVEKGRPRTRYWRKEWKGTRERVQQILCLAVSCKMMYAEIMALFYTHTNFHFMHQLAFNIFTQIIPKPSLDFIQTLTLDLQLHHIGTSLMFSNQPDSKSSTKSTSFTLSPKLQLRLPWKTSKPEPKRTCCEKVWQEIWKTVSEMSALRELRVQLRDLVVFYLSEPDIVLAQKMRMLRPLLGVRQQLQVFEVKVNWGEEDVESVVKGLEGESEIGFQLVAEREAGFKGLRVIIRGFEADD